MDKKTFIISIIGAAIVSLVLGFYGGRYFERINARKNFQNIRGNFQGRAGTSGTGLRRSGSFPGGALPSGSQTVTEGTQPTQTQ
jgi:hypothetical protein